MRFHNPGLTRENVPVGRILLIALAALSLIVVLPGGPKQAFGATGENISIVVAAPAAFPGVSFTVAPSCGSPVGPLGGSGNPPSGNSLCVGGTEATTKTVTAATNPVPGFSLTSIGCAVTEDLAPPNGTTFGAPNLGTASITVNGPATTEDVECTFTYQAVVVTTTSTTTTPTTTATAACNATTSTLTAINIAATITGSGRPNDGEHEGNQPGQNGEEEDGQNNDCDDGSIDTEDGTQENNVDDDVTTTTTTSVATTTSASTTTSVVGTGTGLGANIQVAPARPARSNGNGNNGNGNH